jgi:putative resolvase
MYEQDKGLISGVEACRLLGVSAQTLRYWDKKNKITVVRAPSGRRLYNPKELGIVGHNEEALCQKRKIIYARVSSRGQQDDLARQVEYLQSKFPTHILVKDIGSGINWKRKGLCSILEQANRGGIQEVVVAHKDRLTRIGFDLVETVLALNKVKLVVLDSDIHKSTEEELADDLMSIVHVYSCKHLGKRRYANQKDTLVPIQATDNDIQGVDTQY